MPAAQVENNRESTDRQYALAHRAHDLGWPDDRVIIIDEDLGLSGSGSVARPGFARLAAEVALGHVGLVLGLEVSRLARNNADWYRLIDLCGLSNTLIGDAEGTYDQSCWCPYLLMFGPKLRWSISSRNATSQRCSSSDATKRLSGSTRLNCRSASSAW